MGICKVNDMNTIQESYSGGPPVTTGPGKTIFHQTSVPSPAVTSKLRGVLETLGAFLLYLAVTGLCLRLAWFIPGRGMDIILLRLLIGVWTPGTAVLVFYPVLRKKRQKMFMAGCILGMCCVSIALTFGANVILSKFRL